MYLGRVSGCGDAYLIAARALLVFFFFSTRMNGGVDRYEMKE